ncbi:MAG: antitoxin [Deltaproteobacteria bacterium]|nr:antitoxin [Deltaproteobacteria bacterium]
MARTTVDIDAPVLRELKKLQKKHGEPLGRLVSRLLARALDGERERAAEPRPFRWQARPMGEPRIDIEDKDALWAMLDGGEPGPDAP